MAIELMRSELQQRIGLAPGPASDSRTGPSPCLLPAQPTPLIGRAGELDLARRTLVQEEVRLLTFTGPAGTGKTRLAVATAENTRDVFVDGVFFVDLAPTEDPGQVTAIIAEALGAPGAGEQTPLARVVGCLSGSRTLLILDNFEHVLAAAKQISTLLATCPGIKILATSRAALRLRWEHVFPVGPLALPTPDAYADLALVNESPAVRLFVSCARAANASFELTAQNAAAVAQLCTQLDGLPLAIELAAARTRLFSPQLLLLRLQHQLDLLVDGALDLPARQRTARAAIGYSYDLLAADERTLFRKLAVFASGCTPESAAAASRDDDVDLREDVHTTTLDRLASLAHKSLLHEELSPNGEIRFRMLQTVRAYAVEQLMLSGELAQGRQRALEYFLAFVDKARIGLLGHAQGTWLDLLEQEHDNLRGMLRWCIESADAQGGLQLASRLERFWELRGLLTEGRVWLAQVLALPGGAATTALRAEALGAAGNLAYSQGDDSSADTFHTQSLAIRRELGDRDGLAASLATLGMLAHRRGDNARARAMLDESLALRRELGVAWGIASVLHQIGEVACEPGQFPTAFARFEESLVQWHSLGDSLSVAMALESLANLAQARGSSARALRLIGAASRLREHLPTASSSTVEQARLQRTVTAAESVLGIDAAVACREDGRLMGLDEAVLYARTLQQHASNPPPAPSSASVGAFGWLTRREQEVAALLLRGLSNRQIAEELVVTERTAETHVCRILSKLGLGSRAQIASWLMDRTHPELRLAPPGLAPSGPIAGLSPRAAHG